MARPEGVPSNELFDILAQWNKYLEQENFDFKGPQP